MHQTILLGIDGATFHVLDALVRDGYMPNLEAFMADGARANLLSTPHPFTPPAWTTVMTGKTPGNHGIFDFIWAEERGDQAYFTLNNFRDIQSETIWGMVSRHGGRATSLNFHFMAPPPVNAGNIVPGLVSWKHLRRNTQPPELYEELKRLPGFDAKEVAWDFDREKRATKVMPSEEREEWVSFHIERERHWYDIFRYCFQHRPADLTAVLIDGVDKLQHICWDCLDPDFASEQRDPVQVRVRGLCIQYFRDLDRFIGDVCELASPDGRVFIVSDHGFGPTQKVFRVNKWLEENGYLSWGKSGHLDKNQKAKIDKMANGHFVHLDWAGTTAYAQSAATNGIHIRVAREPGQTGIQPGEYESFRDRLIHALYEERDDDGIRIVRDILKKEEVFPGDHNGRCPDLTLLLHDYGFVSTLNADPIHWNRPEVVGTHNPIGVFLARGPGILRGQEIAQQMILDVAPTVLYSLGLEIPEDLDGFVMQEAFESAYLDVQDIVTGEPTVSPHEAETAGALADVVEEKIILDRLRALGYVE